MPSFPQDGIDMKSLPTALADHMLLLFRSNSNFHVSNSTLVLTIAVLILTVLISIRYYFHLDTLGNTTAERQRSEQRKRQGEAR